MTWTEKYCSPSGGGAHDGSTAADAWTLAEAIAGEAAGNRVNFLAGTYANTSTSRTLVTPGTAAAPIWWRGYKTTIGDQDGNNLAVAGTDIPSITFTTGGLASGVNFRLFSNLDITGATTSGKLFNCTTSKVIIYRCRFRQTGGSVACTAISGSGSTVAGCYFSSSVSQALCVSGIQQTYLGNYFVGGNLGLSGGANTALSIQCNVFDSIGGDAIPFSTGYGVISGNSIYAPTGHGVTWSGAPSGYCSLTNNHFENVNQSGKAAINNASGSVSAQIVPFNNSFYSNTANIQGQTDCPDIWSTTLAGSGFANAAAGDFTPSSLLRSLGFPGAFENISAFVGYLGLGAVQAAAGGSGGGPVVGCNFIKGVPRMSVRSAQSITVEFVTSNPTTQAAVNADALPVGKLVVNGTDNAAVVTVTNVDTGRYKAAVTLPTLAVGDVAELVISATVSSVAGKAVVWRDYKDVLLDSNGDVTFNNTTIATATNLTNAPQSGDLTATMKLSVATAATAATPTVSLNLTQSIPTSNTAQTVGDALNTARAQGFGEWVLSGTTLTLYAPDGTTVVRTFTLDSATAPTTRS